MFNNNSAHSEILLLGVIVKNSITLFNNFVKDLAPCNTLIVNNIELLLQCLQSNARDGNFSR